MTSISTLDPIVVHLRLVENYSHAPDTRLRPPENNKPRSTRPLTARLKAAFCPCRMSARRTRAACRATRRPTPKRIGEINLGIGVLSSQGPIEPIVWDRDDALVAR